MEITDQQLEKLVLTRVMRLNAVAQGIVLGLVLGLGIFIATLWLVIKGGPVVGPHLGLLSQFFIGYDVTLVGSLVGFAYGFFSGFIVGYFIARIYNLVAEQRELRLPVSRRSVTITGLQAASAGTRRKVLQPSSGEESR
jgi:hypothetical protein